MLLCAQGRKDSVLSLHDLKSDLFVALRKLGPRNKVLIVPPDFTRVHSRAGLLSRLAWEYYETRVTDVLPAVGTHVSMTDEEIDKMFGRLPRELFRTQAGDYLVDRSDQPTGIDLQPAG